MSKSPPKTGCAETARRPIIGVSLIFAIATSPLSFIATAPISFTARAGVSLIAEVPVQDVKPVSLISTLKVGDGVLAGDIGFDPLGLGDTSEKLTFYR